jgi:NADPH:quinone reductase-like Zn-dependent oxidoreductase
MRAMQQAAWGGSEPLRLVEVEAPRLTFGEVLVRVHAAGVNPVDVYTRRGQAYNQVLPLPFVNGWDVAGVAEETGYGTTRFQAGDAVFGMPWFPRAAGAYAEYVTAPARHFAHIPGETVAFRAVANGTEEAARPFTAFLRAFPDYRVELEYLVGAAELVICAGTIRATMAESLAGIEPTHESDALPFACHWTVRDGLIAHERFFFDFHQMCEQLGLPTDAAAATFAAWRKAA